MINPRFKKVTNQKLSEIEVDQDFEQVMTHLNSKNPDQDMKFPENAKVVLPDVEIQGGDIQDVNLENMDVNHMTIHNLTSEHIQMQDLRGRRLEIQPHAVTMQSDMAYTSQGADFYVVGQKQGTAHVPYSQIYAERGIVNQRRILVAGEIPGSDVRPLYASTTEGKLQDELENEYEINSGEDTLKMVKYGSQGINWSKYTTYTYDGVDYTLKTIGADVFKNEDFTPRGDEGEIVIPQTVKSIEAGAFQGFQGKIDMRAVNKDMGFVVTDGAFTGSSGTLQMSTVDFEAGINKETGVLYIDVNLQEGTYKIHDSVNMAVKTPHKNYLILSWVNVEGTDVLKDVAKNVTYEILDRDLKTLKLVKSNEVLTSYEALDHETVDFTVQSTDTSAGIHYQDGYRLLEIGEDAFKDQMGLVLNQLPNTIQTIGTKAFADCSQIALKKLPNSLLSVGSLVFATARTTSMESSLQLQELPLGLTSLGNAMFGGLHFRETLQLKLHENFQSLYAYAFSLADNFEIDASNCNSLTIDSDVDTGTFKLATNGIVLVNSTVYASWVSNGTIDETGKIRGSTSVYADVSHSVHLVKQGNVYIHANSEYPGVQYKTLSGNALQLVAFPENLVINEESVAENKTYYPYLAEDNVLFLIGSTLYTLTTIGEPSNQDITGYTGVFENRQDLQGTIQFGNSITEVGYRAFYGCNVVKGVVLNSTLKQKCYTKSFANMTDLQYFQTKCVGGETASITYGDLAFENDSSLQVIDSHDATYSYYTDSSTSLFSFKDCTSPSITLYMSTTAKNLLGKHLVGSRLGVVVNSSNVASNVKYSLLTPPTWEEVQLGSDVILHNTGTAETPVWTDPTNGAVYEIKDADARTLILKSIPSDAIAYEQIDKETVTVQLHTNTGYRIALLYNSFAKSNTNFTYSMLPNSINYIGGDALYNTKPSKSVSLKGQNIRIYNASLSNISSLEDLTGSISYVSVYGLVNNTKARWYKFTSDTFTLRASTEGGTVGDGTYFCRENTALISIFFPNLTGGWIKGNENSVLKLFPSINTHLRVYVPAEQGETIRQEMKTSGFLNAQNQFVSNTDAEVDDMSPEEFYGLEHGEIVLKMIRYTESGATKEVIRDVETGAIYEVLDAEAHTLRLVSVPSTLTSYPKFDQENPVLHYGGVKTWKITQIGAMNYNTEVVSQQGMLKNVSLSTIPNSVEKLGHQALSSNSTIQTLNLSHIQECCDGSLYVLSKLTQLTLSATTFGYASINNCTKLKTVTFTASSLLFKSSTVYSVGNHFVDCTALTDIYCPNLTSAWVFEENAQKRIFYRDGLDVAIHVPTQEVFDLMVQNQVCNEEGYFYGGDSGTEVYTKKRVVVGGFPETL